MTFVSFLSRIQGVNMLRNIYGYTIFRADREEKEEYEQDSINFAQLRGLNQS